MIKTSGSKVSCETLECVRECAKMVDQLVGVKKEIERGRG
jgi:hypothetical protein